VAAAAASSEFSDDVAAAAASSEFSDDVAAAAASSEFSDDVAAAAASSEFSLMSGKGLKKARDSEMLGHRRDHHAGEGGERPHGHGSGGRAGRAGSPSLERRRRYATLLVC
jgi:hypothetical protein